MTKFYEEFVKLSKNEFPMLKFHSADYSFNKQIQQEMLQVRFLISAFDMKDLTDDIKPLEVDQLEASALAIEKIWDEAEYLPDIISKVPD